MEVRTWFGRRKERPSWIGVGNRFFLEKRETKLNRNRNRNRFPTRIRAEKVFLAVKTEKKAGREGKEIWNENERKEKERKKERAHESSALQRYRNDRLQPVEHGKFFFPFLFFFFFLLLLFSLGFWSPWRGEETPLYTKTGATFFLFWKEPARLFV